jgi:hypothetical protein
MMFMKSCGVMLSDGLLTVLVVLEVELLAEFAKAEPSAEEVDPMLMMPPSSAETQSGDQ